MSEAMSTIDGILVAMHRSPFSALGVSEIAAGAGYARSTVYRHLPKLLEDRLIRYTSYVGQWALAPAGRERAKELVA
jgi:DNA-binding IclR family transcriptional regulator